MGSRAFPYTFKILKAIGDPLGPRVVFLASQIGDDESLKLIRRAARNPDRKVRAAVAFVLPELPVDKLGDVPIRLLSDPDPQVTYHAIRSID